MCLLLTILRVLDQLNKNKAFSLVRTNSNSSMTMLNTANLDKSTYTNQFLMINALSLLQLNQNVLHIKTLTRVLAKDSMKVLCKESSRTKSSSKIYSHLPHLKLDLFCTSVLSHLRERPVMLPLRMD